MKKYILLLLAAPLFFSCKEDGKNPEVEEKVADVKVADATVTRFDDLFYNATPADIPALKAKYSYMFDPRAEDSVYENKIKNPLLQELHGEVDKQFPPNSNKLKDDITELYRHIKYFYPKAAQPKVVTLISEMDYQNRIIYTDSLLLVSLDLYLGSEHRYYVDFPVYLRAEFQPQLLMPDVVSAFATRAIPPRKDNTLLSFMITYGKELYMKDMFLPDTPDYDKIGYTKKQLEWAFANEAEMWRFFVEDKLFFDSDPKLPNRFINPAPFSKFYLGFDNESPGRLGQWMGWQIVRAYMENNKNVTLQQLMATDAKVIFDNSKYKPAK
jgi:gliding motility-associated lipoprotein GldB